MRSESEWLALIHSGEWRVVMNRSRKRKLQKRGESIFWCEPLSCWVWRWGWRNKKNVIGVNNAM